MPYLIDKKSRAKKLLIPLLAIGVFALFLVLVVVLSTPRNQPNILVTEILASNRGVVTDEDGDFPDFIELYNAGKSDVSLIGWFLSDNSNRPMRWVIPDVVIKAGEYVYFFASGKDKQQANGIWHTNFSVAADGTEQIVLSMPDGTVHQQVGPIEALPNVSYGLDEKFLYYRYMSEPTPGSANVPPFYNDLDSVVIRQDVILITEYMTQNTSFFPDENGLYHDWVELHNPSDEEVSLDGWYLSDSAGRPDKWRFPRGVSIAAGGYLALHCSGLDLPNHVSFRLSAGDGSLRLSDYNRMKIDEIVLVETPTYASYGRLPDGAAQNTGGSAGGGTGQLPDGAAQDTGGGVTYGFFSVPTPGGPTTEIPAPSLSELTWRKPTVLIMEYMSNNTIIIDEDGETSDWAEIFNFGSEPVDLSEMYLSDSRTSLDKWSFPQGFVLAPDERAVVWLTNKDRYLHASFSLSERDDGLFLSDKYGRIIDFAEVIALPQHVSAGRDENDFDRWLFFPRPTQGGPNDTIGFAELAGLHTAGWGDSKAVAAIIEADAAAAYPDWWANQANQENQENGGWALTFLTAAPTFAAPPQIDTDDIHIQAGTLVSLWTGESGGVIRYTLDGSEPTASSRIYDGPIAINRSTALRARVFTQGKEPSAVLTRTYLVGAVHNIPIVTLTTDPAGMFSEETGIYANGPGWVEGEFPYQGANYWKDWERATHFAFYEAGRLCVEADAGIRIHGQFSRALSQKSLAVFFRNQYGLSRLAYPLIPDINRTVYDALILRSGGQDLLRTKVREAFIHNSILDVTNVVAMGARPVAVYVNGEYFGLYNLREKINEDYFAINEGIPDDEIDIIKANRNALAGTAAAYTEMVETLRDMKNMNTNEAYAYVDANIDLDNWIDYWIAVTFFGNPDTGNIKCYRQQGEGHKWRWILFDQDYGAVPSGANPFDNMLHPEGHGYEHLFSTVIARSLMNNDEIRQRFLKRYAELLQTVLETDRLLAVFEDYVSQVEAEMPLQITRWTAPASMEAWEGHLNQTRTFISIRGGQMRRHIKETFELSDNEMSELFGE